MQIPDFPTRGGLTVPPDLDLPPIVLKTTLEALLDLELPEEIDWGEVRRLATYVRRDRAGWGGRLEFGRTRKRRLIAHRAPEGDPLDWLDHTWQSALETEMALFLVCAWHDATGRVMLGQPLWQILLGPLTAQPAAKKAAPKPKKGWMRATLRPETAEFHRPFNGGLELKLITMNVRGDRVLKPKSVPQSAQKLRSMVEAPRAEELTLVHLLNERRLAARAGGYEHLSDVDHRIFEALAGLEEVWFDGQPVEVMTRPWSPCLTVRDDGPDRLALTWKQGVLASWSAGRGYVLDGDRRLWPIRESQREALVPLLVQGLPPVPIEHVDRFVERFVARSTVPVELESTAVSIELGEPTPKMRLTDDAGDLHVGVAFSYEGQPVTADTGALISAGDRLIRRDFSGEEAWRAALAAEVGRPIPVTLRGDDAFDFLLDAVPALEGWTVEADRGLLKRVRGRISPSVRLESGLDWFGLEVEMEVDGLRVSLQAALRAWREGRRYVRLSDGTAARLPDAWLAQHGETVSELAELRRGKKAARFGAHTAALASELLEEAAQVDHSEALARWRDIARRIRAFDQIPDCPTPAGMLATLRPYQHDGLRWMTALTDLGLGGVLADDMGLGKTVQTLAWMLLQKERAPDDGPTLVIAPTSVVHTWVSEAARFAPSLRAHLHHGAKRGELPAEADLVVTSYALLRHDAERIAAVSWRAVVLDESQYIKNAATATARAARALTARHRLALTGTPMENHLGELWSLFEFLMPGFFGSQKSFGERYAKPIQAEMDPDALSRLRTRIRPFVLRRLKREVASELPPRTEQVLYCDLPKPQRVLYESVREAYRESVMSQVAARGIEGATIQVLEALMRLRQACCHPRLLPLPQAEAVTGSAKLDLFDELVDNLIEEERRALVFSQWPSLLRLVRARLDARGLKYLYLDGSTQARGALQARWNLPDGPPLFLISIKAGGTGLTLTGADVVIHLDPWWNPAVENQATDRAHRIGQTKPVTIYKLVARQTVEEKVLELQARKQALFDATVDAERLEVDSLTRADLEAVFGEAIEAPDDDEEPTPDEVVSAKPKPKEPAPEKPAPKGPVAGDPELVARLFADIDEMTKSELRAALGLSAYATRRWIAAQIEAGLMFRDGHGAATRYAST